MQQLVSRLRRQGDDYRRGRSLHTNKTGGSRASALADRKVQQVVCALNAEIRKLMRAENVLAGPDYMTCDSDGLVLDLDVVTALGIVVTEVVTNSYDHAFPGGKGAINVSVRRAAGDVEMATMTISDNGGGFKAELDSKRHGLGLVRRLVEQVHGTAMVNSDHGTPGLSEFPWPEQKPGFRSGSAA